MTAVPTDAPSTRNVSVRFAISAPSEARASVAVSVTVAPRVPVTLATVTAALALMTVSVPEPDEAPKDASPANEAVTVWPPAPRPPALAKAPGGDTRWRW